MTLHPTVFAHAHCAYCKYMACKGDDSEAATPSLICSTHILRRPDSWQQTVKTLWSDAKKLFLQIFTVKSILRILMNKDGGL